MSTTRAVCTLLVCTVAGLSLGCSGSLPTEPQGAVAIRLSISPVLGGPAGTVTVTGDTCACTQEPFTVSVDGEAAGAIACDGERRFDVAPESFTVTVSVKGAIETYNYQAQGDVPGMGTYLTVRCSTS